MLLAVDPGADAGWAIFDDLNRLAGCGLGVPPPVAAGDARGMQVVIERPKIYPGARQKARPDDIITLAVRAGETAGRALQCGAIGIRYVAPAEWKSGSIPKDIMHARIFRQLDDRERGVIDISGKGMAPSKRHNMLDAVGIGLYGCKRIG